ncbi:diguanylate cyclase [Alteromonas sp. CI.11.F.A3]|uniref:diguanylate cyclase n=1 Tax=Alteromonas sp. CI.11.F.A3 TaxID=3079555 RepID=UPI0029424B8D|nr:diguanylate cyclase [Alteromonas sp. CI.11.F.A3]WOI38630.1 diguanylate cyclase [Alteromonas sp. CI.11.F.A3]
MDDPTLIILMYFIIPIWFVAGIVDWYCHKRSNISGTSGAKESLIHLLMFAEVGIPLFMVLIFEVNSLIIGISILLFFVHEATAMWDVSYAVTKRRVGPIEQHVHSFLEMIPLLALVLVVGRHWPHFTALFGIGDIPADFALQLKEDPLPTWYLVTVLLIALALEFVPYLEELMRGLKDKNQVNSGRSNGTRGTGDRNVTPVSDAEAEAASPYATSVAGEEDPGVALEELVESRNGGTPINKKR